MEKLKNACNTTVDNLDNALQQVTQSTELVSSACQQISAGSQSLAQGANEQASMTKQNAEHANQAKILASEDNRNADQGKHAMASMSESINKIKSSSVQTAKIVKTIDEIAMQTNLLALNAAVEAARAGGIQLYNTKNFNLIITEIILPEQDGIETILTIRKTDRLVPIIAISGGGIIRPEFYLEMALIFGANRSFCKPLDPEIFIPAIKNYLL